MAMLACEPPQSSTNRVKISLPSLRSSPPPMIMRRPRAGALLSDFAILNPAGWHGGSTRKGHLLTRQADQSNIRVRRQQIHAAIQCLLQRHPALQPSVYGSREHTRHDMLAD